MATYCKFCDMKLLGFQARIGICGFCFAEFGDNYDNKEVETYSFGFDEDVDGQEKTGESDE